MTGLDDNPFLFLVENVMGLAFDESLDDVFVAAFTSDQERRITTVAFRVKMSAFVDEKTNDMVMAVLAGDDERSGIAADGVDG
jgi:hypothetical protein